MKKRIISLILVVAMAFLTLTGCAYSYAKDDMSKYATLNPQAFYDALQLLYVDDGDFGTDAEARKVKVQDAIAQAILGATDTDDAKYEGKLSIYDAVYYCYYAVSGTGSMQNVLNTANMEQKDLSKLNLIQLGLSSLEGLDKVISDELLKVEDIKDYIYSTSYVGVVEATDVVSVSFVKTWKDGETEKSETRDHFYYSVAVDGNNNTTKEFSKFLVGKKVGEDLGDVTVTETVGEETKEYTYKNVKVESIVKDNTPTKVKDGDKVFVTYTFKIDTEAFYDAEKQNYDALKNALVYPFNDKNIDKEDGTYTQTVTVEYKVVEDVILPAEATDAEKAAAQTFLSQLIGLELNAEKAASFTVENDNTLLTDKTVKVEYSGVKVNWIVSSDMKPITFEYTEEALKSDNSNKKTATTILSSTEKFILNGEKVTYYVFPVCYLDAAELSTELIVREFYSNLAKTETVPHEHSEDEDEDAHEDTTKYVFETLNGNYMNGDKKLSALVEELVALYGSASTAESLLGKEKALDTALTALVSAQEKLAADKGTSENDSNSLLTTKDQKYEDYIKAVEAVAEYQEKVNAKIADILACKDGETAVDLTKDYEQYQYDTLEAAYKNDIVVEIANAIYDYLVANVKFNGDLNKKAVKEAYKAIMNEYKNDFYEGNYTTSSSSSSTSSTNYKHYEGNFDKYLIDKTAPGKTLDDAKAAVQKKAEDTVKEIVIIYVFAEAVEEMWADSKVMLTKEEKKNIKTNLENTALLYQQYGLSYPYNLESTYHAQQFDKALNYLLEETDESEDSATVIFKHIKFTTEVQTETN